MLRKRIPNITSMSSSITCSRFQARNVDTNGEKAVISAKLRDHFRQIVPNFAARFSGVFAEVEAPVDESANH